ncbi:hypothetical protein Q7P37_004377 [Cladosporium fusiforme]
MPHERSPLLERVPVAEPTERYPHTSVRRFCTIVLIAVPLLTLAIVFFCVAIGGDNDLFGDRGTSLLSSVLRSSDHDLPHSSWPQSDGISYSELKKILSNTPDAEKAREWSKYYTAGPHLAGKNLSQAEWTRDRWEEWGVKSDIVAYNVYINYPVDHRLALLKNGKVDFEATLEEDVLEDDPTTGLDDRVPVFHGYSANGNVTAQYVYVNYGTYADFEELQEAGIHLKGKIAIAKYGRIFRGLKVKRAEDLGMLGMVIYSDPGDDGEITEENGHKPYPEGPARHPRSVQRGSVEYLSIGPGDPTTIGYPSKPGVPRQPTEGKIPTIPSLPLSYAEALPLLRALNGHGPKASSLSAAWNGGGLGYKNVSYNIGPTPSEITLNLVNEQEYVTTDQWDTIGIINGSISDEVIIIGNHRDAWVAGGAADPNSGSAALNEVIRSFGVALDKGWKPQRTIVFASWDGEEYGLVGSTEWVEEYLPWLTNTAIAYINVDVGAVGPNFEVSAAPLLNKAIYDVSAQVQSPNQTVADQTVADLWDGYISTMGSGSDFTAFQDFAGIPSINVEFGGEKNGPVYHYHSNYDSFHWMDKYGDPGFKYHEAIAKIIALLAAKLSEEPIVGFNATDYAVGLETYLHRMRQTTKAEDTMGVDVFLPLEKAIQAFKFSAVALDAHASKLQAELSSPNLTSLKKKSLFKKIHATNKEYKLLERKFLYQPGLDTRSWFKHVVFAPGLWTGYAGATFPGIVEAIEFGKDWEVKKWVGIVAGVVGGAAVVLS